MLHHVVLLAMVGLSGPGEDGAIVTPSRVYHAANRSLMVEVNRPGTFGIISLQLMSPEGGVIGDPVEVETGEVDLAVAFPDVWALRDVTFLQPLVRGRPTGPAMVLQPMLSRMVPIAVPAQRPDGRAFLEIQGFEHDHLAS